MEWAFVTSNPLPAYDQNMWLQIYKVIQTQQLAVQFGLFGELTKSGDGGAIIIKVLVTVDYPTKTSGNTFSLTQKMNSLVYTAPGQFVNGIFNNKYTYQYEVFFAADSTTYKSEPVESTDTIIEILPNQLGIRQTTFVGSNIPFNGAGFQTPQTVDKLVIDFFFQTPGGLPNKVESKAMTANGNKGGVLFSSFFHLPLTNTS